MFQRKPQFGILCISSRRISRNGVSISLNTTYTNLNGVGNMFNTIEFRNENDICKNNLNFLDDEMSNFEIEKKNNLKKLKNEHQKNLQRCNSQYLDLKNFLENLKIEENDKKIEQKKEELKRIRNINKNINMDLNGTNLNDSYMFNEKKKLENNYMERRKEINNKYKFKEPELKNSEINNRRKQNYIKNIQRLNAYSNNPNFNNVINNFNLKSFLK
jgi:hypothetical protein